MPFCLCGSHCFCSFYIIAPKFCLKSRVQLTGIAVVAVLCLGCLCMAVPKVQSVNFDLSQTDVCLQSISAKKICAETLSQITLG